jgi:uncharacterized protein YbbK (DUF523 family)
MIRVLVSSCLLGEPVRYDGCDAARSHPVLESWQREGRIVGICPEVAGGLDVPRVPAEIAGGDGTDVLDGRARVMNREEEDVTGSFLRGAEAALEAARTYGAGLAILVERSPSCGSHRIYDGTFTGTDREGKGVTAALLERHGIRVFPETALAEAAAHLAELEGAEG